MMEQFEKWWNEKQSKELTEKFLIENRLVTQEQVIDLLAKTVWRAALEWTLQIKVTSDSSVYLDMLRNKIRDELRNT